VVAVAFETNLIFTKAIRQQSWLIGTIWSSKSVHNVRDRILVHIYCECVSCPDDAVAARDNSTPLQREKERERETASIINNSINVSKLINSVTLPLHVASKSSKISKERKRRQGVESCFY
jgi:hypothetical protein